MKNDMNIDQLITVMTGSNPDLPINGIIIGKPQDEKYYEEYKEVYKRLIAEEAGRPNLPILYNVNIGHTAPMCIFPMGQKIKLDLDNKEIIFLEKPMSD